MLQGSISDKTKQKQQKKPNKQKKPPTKTAQLLPLEKKDFCEREAESCHHHDACGICTMAALFLLCSVSQLSQEDLIPYDLLLLKVASYFIFKVPFRYVIMILPQKIIWLLSASLENSRVHKQTQRPTAFLSTCISYSLSLMIWTSLGSCDSTLNC